MGGAREWKRVSVEGVSGMRSLCDINRPSISTVKGSLAMSKKRRTVTKSRCKRSAPLTKHVYEMAYFNSIKPMRDQRGFHRGMSRLLRIIEKKEP